jgi:hypothetical protein
MDTAGIGGAPITSEDDRRLANFGYLGLMFINIGFPSGITSPREFFNLDWITLAVIFVIAVVGAVYFVLARPDRGARAAPLARWRANMSLTHW